jgi:hypothetical protein
MSRPRWKSAALLAALAGGAFLITGSAAFADPVDPGEKYRLTLRLTADQNCPHGGGTGVEP